MIEKKEIEELQALKIEQIEQAKEHLISQMQNANKIKKIENLCQDIINFIKWVPDQDGFKQISAYTWKGYSMKDIAKMFNTTESKLTRIYKKRHLELRLLYAKELIQKNT